MKFSRPSSTQRTLTNSVRPVLKIKDSVLVHRKNLKMEPLNRIVE